MPPVPVTSTSVDADGNLLLNGSPFLLIQGTNMDYANWLAAGYTEAEADAKLAALRAAGLSALFGNWGEVGSLGWQDLAAWNRHGFYWHGGATLSPFGDGTIENYGLADNPKVLEIVNAFKTRPNLLLWWICNEYNEGIYAPTGQPLGVAVATGRQTIRNADLAHVAGETIVIPVNYWTNSPEALLPSFQVTLGEEVISGLESGEAFLHLYDHLNEMQPYLRRGNGAPDFVLGLSSTPVSEIDGGNTSVRPVAQAEIHRYFMFQVAMNVRAFDVLWGANQRDPKDNIGDAGISQTIRDIWDRSVVEIDRVKALERAILAPAPWTPLVTAPPFEPYAASDTGNDFRGVYAAKKAVDGATYVIACNATFHQDGVTSHWTELPVPLATIDVGQPIAYVQRLFDSDAAPAFAGSVITDAFAPTQARVYRVT